jgi:hypothetical protein
MRKHISFTAFAALLALTMIGCIKSAVHATNAGGPPTVGLSWSIAGSSPYLPIHTLEEAY